MGKNPHPIKIGRPLFENLWEILEAGVRMITHSAAFSPCRLYRYDLWRRWSDKPYCMFIGLNPSTADETQDDPTVRRCINYAKDWGYGGLVMTNIFAYRATLPKDMKAQNEPIGLENDKYLKKLAKNAGIVVAAGGKDGSHLDRGKRVTELIQPLHCLKKNNDGSPAHPLYLRGDLIPFLLV